MGTPSPCSRAARAVTDVLGDGFHLNLGPHALYRKGHAERVLAELGVPVTGERPATEGVLIRDGVAHALPAGPGSLLSTGALRMGQRVALGVALSRLLACKASGLGGSAAEYLDSLTGDPDVRAVMEATLRVATYANCPDQLAASVAVAQVQSAVKHGVTYLHGGWQCLVDGLAAVARAAGAELRTGQKVTALVDGGVQVDGQVFAAEHVVLAVPMQVAKTLLGDRAPAAMATMGPPVRAACLDLALRRLPREKPTLALGFDEPLYISVHTAVAQLAPPGGAVVHAALYLPPGHARRPADDRAVLEEALDGLQPGWRDEVVAQRFLPRMLVVPALPPLTGVSGRPGVQVDERLWLCGDWVGGQGYLADAAFASGAEVAAWIARTQAVAA